MCAVIGDDDAARENDGAFAEFVGIWQIVGDHDHGDIKGAKNVS